MWQKILKYITAGNTKEALDLIATTTTFELDTVFSLGSRQTTLLCKAALLKMSPVVKALLAKKVNLNVRFTSDEALILESIISRLIMAKDFDEKSCDIAKILIAQGAELNLRMQSDPKKANLHVNMPFSLIKYINYQILNGNIKDPFKTYALVQLILGNRFLDEVLFLKDKEDKTPLQSVLGFYADNTLKSKLYHYLLDEAISIATKQKNTMTDHQLTRLLTASNSDPRVSALIKNKLQNNPEQHKTILFSPKPKGNTVKKTEPLPAKAHHTPLESTLNDGDPRRSMRLKK